MDSGILSRHEHLTECGVFAVAVFTIELRILFDDANTNGDDEFYRQFGKVLRYRNAADMLKLQTYIYHFFRGLQALPRYTGTLWRGVKGDFAETACNNFKLDGIINFNSFSSASPSRPEAIIFVGFTGILLKFVNVV